jgi:2-polyprenyl-6-methoxyphenol hydroxylase-like FAD-dependent oxidoreductase
MPSAQHPTVIVGAGIGGLALSIALRQQGAESIIVERADELREVGAGLLLSPNACAVLEKLGVLPQVLASSIPTPRWDLLTPSGSSLASLHMAKAGEQSVSTRRSDLQMALLSRVPPDSIRLGCSAEKAILHPDHVEVRLSDGSKLLASRVMVADGTHSAIRSQHWPDRGPRYRGYIGWRALVDHVPAGWETGRVTETWGRGRRFGIGHVGGGKTYWYASANVPAREAQLKTPLSQLQEDFRHWHSPIQDLLARTAPEALLQHPIADATPSWQWQKAGLLALLGDAAHPLTPNLGQGAAMALEDAWELAQCWPKADALQRCESRRRLKLFRIWAASRWVGKMIQWENPVLCFIRDAQLKVLPSQLTTSLMRFILLR